MENESDEPEHSYRISLRSLSLAVAGRKSIPVGIYHSHLETKAEPSVADTKQLILLSQNNDQPLMFIYGTDGLRVWSFDGTLIEFDLTE